MGAEAVRVARGVVDAWERLSDEERDLARGALVALAENPIAGSPLFEPLRGLWVFRHGGARIVYRVSRDGSTAGVVLIELPGAAS